MDRAELEISAFFWFLLLVAVLIDRSPACSPCTSIFGDIHVRHLTDTYVGIATSVCAAVGVLLKTALAGWLVAAWHRQLGRFVSQQAAACERFH